MNKLKLSSILLLGICIFFCGSMMAQTTRIFLVRHADRQPSDDLNAAGLVRAEELKRVLFNTGIDSVFSTDFIRTKKTVKPFADAKGLPVILYDNNTSLFKRILSKGKRRTLLVAGHSNTVPQLIKLCGCKPPFENIPDMQFDNLFLIILEEDKIGKFPKMSCKLLHMKYGAITP